MTFEELKSLIEALTRYDSGWESSVKESQYGDYIRRDDVLVLLSKYEVLVLKSS
jgi:hypothetical protein